MKILFADAFPTPQLERLRGEGHQCEFAPALTREELPSAVPGFEALVVRSTRVGAAVLGAGDSLKLVVRAGAGTNTIETARVRELGIDVCNVPGANAFAVAELTLGLIISADRRIPDNVADLRNGAWNKKRYSKARGLFGRSLGVVGAGAIGLAVAERAAAFGMRILVLASPRRGDAARARLAAIGATEIDSLGKLAENSDFLTLHVPGGAQTAGLINRDILARMRPGTVLVNTSRSDVIDGTALIEAMDTKGIRAVADVFDDEPASGEARFDSPLARHSSVYGTHHIGASTEQAQLAVADGVAGVIAAFVGGKVIHRVNAAPNADDDTPSLDLEPADGFEQLLGAAVHYRIATGPHTGRKALTLHTVASNPLADNPCIAQLSGFSLHAGTRCRAHERDSLERLCRYIARPAVSNERLSVNDLPP